MDRPIPQRERDLRRYRLIALAAASAVAIAFLLAMLPGWVRPGVRRDQIRTATVERGPIAATVTAAGTVVPVYEHLVTSPIDTRVVRRLVAPGDTLAEGAPVVQLDVATTELALQRLDDQRALKRNERDRAGLELDEQLGDLRAERDVARLALTTAEFEAARNREYYDQGLFSQDDVRRADADAERHRIELQRLDDALAGAARLHQARLAGLDLELSILDKDRAEAVQLATLARPVAGRGGVVTWVVESEGAAVRRGDVVARLADLSAFRVEATISDVHASRVRAGLPAVVAIGDARLAGNVVAVRPTVEDGLIVLEVALDEPSHPALRTHLRVDVYVVTDRREDALRLARGSFLNLDGRTAVYVVRGSSAYRTVVELGLANFECHEVIAGLAAGDEVILSDMSNHRGLEEVRIR